MPKETDRAIKAVIRSTESEDHTEETIAKYMPLFLAILKLFERKPKTKAMAQAALKQTEGE